MKKAILKELYATPNGIVWQDNTKCQLIFEWQGYSSALNFACFVSLLKLTDNISIENLLASDTPDLEIVNPCGCDRVFVLTVAELLEMQDLLQGARFALNLNSLLHAQLYRPYQFA